MEGRSDGLELSLKLYHLGELQLAHQQLMAEAPADFFVATSTTITNRELTFRSTKTLRYPGQCIQPNESSPSRSSVDSTTDTNDEPLDRWTHSFNIWSHPSRQPLSILSKTLGQNWIWPLASNRPKGGLFLCSMEFLVGTTFHPFCRRTRTDSKRYRRARESAIF
jgi:hypothetical protein